MGAEGKYDLELSEDPAPSPVPNPGEVEGEEDKESDEPAVELDEVCMMGEEVLVNYLLNDICSECCRCLLVKGKFFIA